MRSRRDDLFDWVLYRVLRIDWCEPTPLWLYMVFYPDRAIRNWWYLKTGAYDVLNDRWTILGVTFSREFIKGLRDGHTMFYRSKGCREQGYVLYESLAVPVEMVLHCPKCGYQHLDPWNSLSHKDHYCEKCGTVWRPARIETTGVEKL